MPVLEMWSDLHCPYAYLAAFRLRRALAEAHDVEVRHRALAIEWVDRKATPKDILDAESPFVFTQEPDLDWQPWSDAPWRWPATMWPTFEAVKAAEAQGWRAAHELDWALRRAFFAESRCISLRHVILDVAREVPALDAQRLERDWDAGVAKARVIEEARRGWETLDLQLSPTFVLPDGTRVENPGSCHVELDEERGHRVRRVVPPKEDAREAYRAMLARLRRP